MERKEAAPGFEPGDKGFANRKGGFWGVRVSPVPVAFRAMFIGSEPARRVLLSDLQKPLVWLENRNLYATTFFLTESGGCHTFCGMSEWRLRKRPPRRAYYVEFWHGGKWHSLSTKVTNKPLALKIARRVYGEAMAGRFAVATGDRYPIGDLLERYLELCETGGLSKKTIVRARGAIGNVITGLNLRYADELSTRMLQDYVRRRLSGKIRIRQRSEPRKASPFTVNAELAHLKAFLRACVRQRWLSRVPCEFRMLRTPTRGRVVFLSQSEVGPFLDHLEPRARWAAFVILQTGLRCEEMMFLEWEDIAFDAGILWVSSKPRFDYAPKGGRDRSVPLSPDLAAELVERRKKAGWVCDGPSGGQINRAWFAKAVARAGKAVGRAERITPHVLRHTFGTLLAMSGAPLPAIQNIMGHANLSTTAIYLHVSDEARRDAIAKLPRLPLETLGQKVIALRPPAASGGEE